MLPSEILDKLSILVLKKQYSNAEDVDEAIMGNVANFDLDTYRFKGSKFLSNPEVAMLYAELFATNQDLWLLEDEIRQAIKHGNMTAVADLAIKIVKSNDNRSYVKNLIDEASDSKYSDFKYYTVNDGNKCCSSSGNECKGSCHSTVEKEIK